MRFALVTLGSTGDLYPFLAIGRALAEQGHEVFLLSQAPYQPEAERAGLRFIPVADTAAHQRTMTHPKLWHPVDGLGVFWRHLCLPAARPTWQALQQLGIDCSAEDPLRVLASPLAVGARLARDTGPVRLWTAYLSPAGLRNLDDPMFLGPWRVPPWVPGPLRRLAWGLLDHWKLEPMARQPVANLATQLGAARPEGSLFGDWIHSPDGGLALYDAVFAPLPSRLSGVLGSAERKAHLQQVGFPNFEWAAVTAAGVSEPPDMPAPWVLFGGTAGTLDAAASHGLAQSLATQSRRPCVLLEREPPPCEPGDTSLVLRRPLQTLPPLLGRAHAFIHHGGIGSCAQGLAAGVPQLLIPRAYDQFENAAAIQRMGAGWTMPSSISRAGLERQAAWLAAQPGRPRPAPPSPYSLPGVPNEAVSAAMRHLTALT